MPGMNDNANLYEQSLTYNRHSGPYQFLALPWFIRAPHQVYYPRHRCIIEPLICGEKVFQKIADDIKTATRSVDIITWGFDPGMVLKRGTRAQDGQRYGDLLIEVATRKKDPVIVRLIVWHDDQASETMMKNIPGVYGPRFPAVGCTAETGFYSESHQRYNAEWFEKICKGRIPNICFHVRSMLPEFFPKSIRDEFIPPSISLLATARFPTHHQKMLLIDYEIPPKAVGYVMGHNSITDFWDTAEHVFQDPRRETFYHDDPTNFSAGPALDPGAGAYLGYYQPSEAELETKRRALENYAKRNSFVAKPYQDVSSRLRGTILYDLNHNFCQAWSESTPPSSLFMDAYWLVTKYFSRMHYQVGRFLQKKIESQPDASFVQRRDAIGWEKYDVAGEHSVQLMRTQPMHEEKAIKECYANLTRQMHHYIFIQNQYIQYETWAKHLELCISNLRKGGYTKPVYVFILTSTPERAGMDLPTYDVAKHLGQSARMKFEHDEALQRAQQGKQEMPISFEALSKQGINVVMGSLWTCLQPTPQPDEYEEIYIHAKVAIVDDAAFTIGSANLNLRSMAIDSELNILSQAQDVAYKLRCDLFNQCFGASGPSQYADMKLIFSNWQEAMERNLHSLHTGRVLESQLVSFSVDRKPGMPVI